MIRRASIFVALLLLAACGALFVRYSAWREHAATRLESGSEVVETARGPVEAARFGTVGPTLLVLHGTPGGYDQVTNLGAPAAEAGFRMIAVSRPGYLRTPLEVGGSPAEQSDAYAALLDALGVESVAVIGISGGGPSALEFAIRHPDRCWALVSLMGVSRTRLAEEPNPGEDLASPIVRWLLGTDLGGWAVSGLVERNPRALLDSIVPDPEIRERILGDPHKRERLVALLMSGLRLPSRRAAGTENDMLQFDALGTPELARIRAPTLVLHGTHDVNVPLAMGERVAQQVPGARLVTFAGADHFMVISHDTEVFGAMFEFLQSVRDGADR